MLKLVKTAFFCLALIPGCFFALTAAPAIAGGVNPGVVEIDSPGVFTKIVAVSDVHGMYKPLLALLRNARMIDKANNWIAGKTLLIIIGDSINKGPDSVETIDLWMALSEQAPVHGGRVIHLLGNHEAEFLADPKGSDKLEEFRDELKAKDIRVKEFTHPGQPRADFLYSMPVAARVGKWLFCHSGLLPDKSWEHFKRKAAEVVQAGDYSVNFLLGEDSILESDHWWADAAGRKDLKRRLSDNGLFGVVFGHRSAPFNAEGRSAISTDRRLIKIDNGMTPDAGSHPGSLLIFPHPAELLSAAPVSVETIRSTGQQKPLKP